MIMPENITNEMVMKSNGIWFGRLVEEEREEEDEDDVERLPAWDYVTQSLLVIVMMETTSEASENSFEN